MNSKNNKFWSSSSFFRACYSSRWNRFENPLPKARKTCDINPMQNVAKAIATLLTALIFTSCAIPSSPTGGPPDREPPQIISLNPRPGTTNFTGNTLEFTFNEYINRQTFQRALSIQPDLKLRTSIDWKRTTATVKFEDDIPENTTLIITLGTDLTDIRSNKLKEPIQFAVSTGPTIADGQIRVRVANYKDGQTQEGRTVFLYRLEESEDEKVQPDPATTTSDSSAAKLENPATLGQAQIFDPTAPPTYVAQTDTGGIAKFIALADGIYRPIWVDDRNRSRTWEPDREPAQPFDTPAVEIRLGQTLDQRGEPDSSYTPQVWVYQPDTTKPTLQAVGVTSERRLRLRFNEPVEFTPDSFLEVYSDSTNSQPFTQAIPLYVLPEDSTIIVAQTLAPLPADLTFNIQVVSESEESTNATPQIRDKAGNLWNAPTTIAFTGSATSDQTELEIVETSLTQNPNPTINDSLTITFNSLIQPGQAQEQIATLAQQVIDSTQFIWDNQLISSAQAISEGKLTITADQNRLIFAPAPVSAPNLTQPWPINPSPTIQLYDPITKSRNPITPNFTDPAQFGNLEIKIQEPEQPRTATLVIQLETQEGEIIWSAIVPSTNSETDEEVDVMNQIPVQTEAIPQTQTQAQTQTISTTPLPQGTYRLRYFIDKNGDSKWQKGDIGKAQTGDQSQIGDKINASQSPEPHILQIQIKIINGFTGEIELQSLF